jgi:hypothetical protein
VCYKKFLQVYYKHQNEINECESRSNVVLASFVTCYGRLKLLSEMTKLDKLILYTDTDSYYWISRIYCYKPIIGNYLGQLTNEIDANGSVTKTDIADSDLNIVISMDTPFMVDNVQKNVKIACVTPTPTPSLTPTQTPTPTISISNDFIQTILCEKEYKKIYWEFDWGNFEIIIDLKPKDKHQGTYQGTHQGKHYNAKYKITIDII